MDDHAFVGRATDAKRVDDADNDLRLIDDLFGLKRVHPRSVDTFVPDMKQTVLDSGDEAPQEPRAAS